MRRAAILLAAGCVLLALATLPGRGGAPSSRLERLVRAPLLELRQESRPAVRLGRGEAVSVRADVRRGAELRFAWAALAGTSDTAPLRLDVFVDDELALSRRAVRRHERWQPLSLRLDREGPVSLRFRAGPGEGHEPALALAGPRLYLPAPAARRRILVWISQDALRADRLSAYGYPRATAPTLERLAKGCVLFENAWSPSSWTLPALASQFSSRLPSFAGPVLERGARDPSATTIFETLAGRGFTVLGVTGNRFFAPAFGLSGGFDVVRHTSLGADGVNQQALALLDEAPGGDLALFVHYMDAHFPYEPPPPFDRLFGAGPDVRETRPDAIEPSPKSPAEVARLRDLYDGEAAYADSRIGQLLDALEARGLLDGAVIAYSADHGEELLDHGRWAHTKTLFEELVHVPLALRLPGVPPRRVSQPVSLVDLAPTLLEALGIARPASFQGTSLVPLARDGQGPRSPLLAETVSWGGDGLYRLAARDGPRKLVLRARRGSLELLGEEFYDLASDPGECRPQPAASAPAGLRAAAREHLARARARHAEAGPPLLDPETEAELRALGYLR